MEKELQLRYCKKCASPLSAYYWSSHYDEVSGHLIFKYYLECSRFKPGPIFFASMNNGHSSDGGDWNEFPCTFQIKVDVQDRDRCIDKGHYERRDLLASGADILAQSTRQQRKTKPPVADVCSYCGKLCDYTRTTCEGCAKMKRKI